MKLTTFFISKFHFLFQIYAKILTVPESTFKIKAMLPWILFEILLTSSVICKQRYLHVQQLYDCCTTAHTFFTGRSILGYFLRLNCYNFFEKRKR